MKLTIYIKIKMPQLLDLSRDPYGLNGGKILSGSANTLADAFWYYPVTNTTAIVTFSNLSGSTISASFTAGNGVFGAITQVSQSSGIAILYSGSYQYPLP